MKVRVYHGIPTTDHRMVHDIAKSAIKYAPAVTNNFAMAAWHALKHGLSSGYVLACSIDPTDAEYTFCRSKNDDKKVYKFDNDIPSACIMEILHVERNGEGMATICDREKVHSELL